MLEENKITKANDLNLRAYQLSRTEQLFILSIISMIQPEDEDFKTYTLNIKDFINLLELDGASQYGSLPKLTKGLMTKVIEIRRPHSLLQVAWFSSVEHRLGEGMIQVEFSPKLKPYLLGLKDNFVSYGLKQVSTLASKYSIRIYELLRQNYFKKTTIFSINELRLLIGITDDVYPLYGNFKKKVLTYAQKELTTKTDLTFNFEEIKTGRRVTSIKFYISESKTKKIENSNAKNFQVLSKKIENVIGVKISHQAIKRLILEGEEETINYYLDNWSNFANCNARNIAGFFIRCIKEKYEIPISQAGKPVQATNYEQRQYGDDFYENLYDNLK